MAELILVGLDVSVTRNEVKIAVAREGGCSPDDISIGLIKTFPRGIGYVWVKCPLVEANLLSEKKKIKIGWASVKINILLVRRIQCFRCLRPGHTKARCDEIDRSDLCYNCGQKGHKENMCKEKTKCILCEEAGKTHNHILGGPKCMAPSSKGRTTVFRRSPTKSSRNEGAIETTSQNAQKKIGNNDTDRGVEVDINRMETEEMDNSVESDLIEDHYGDEGVAKKTLTTPG